MPTYRQPMPPSLLRRTAALLSLPAFLALCACSTTEQNEIPAPEPVKTSGVSFEKTDYSVLPHVDTSGWEGALSAFQTSCTAMGKDPLWRDLCQSAVGTDSLGAQRFFMANFTPWQVKIESYDDGILRSTSDTGLMTGYYEPLLYGSRTKTPPFIFPIYGVPDDLIVVDLDSIYPALKGLRLRGKLEGRRLVPYDTRGDIQERNDMSHWAIAWVNDPVDAFFLHVQGSGRIQLPDGTFMRVGFADQNGYRYRSIGNWLIKNGHLQAHELSMQKIRAWAKAHPSKVKEALAQNPSYVFFAERKASGNQGPLGAQGVPLTPRSSVAVDPRFWKMGTPFIVSAQQENPDLAFVRPVIAQDTGGAIRGAIRFDYFWGFGDQAGEAAGRQRSRATAWVLVPNLLTPDDIRRK